MPTIELPDKGVSLEFPDNMSQTEISTAINQHFYGQGGANVLDFADNYKATHTSYSLGRIATAIPRGTAGVLASMYSAVAIQPREAELATRGFDQETLNLQNFQRAFNTEDRYRQRSLIQQHTASGMDDDEAWRHATLAAAKQKGIAYEGATLQPYQQGAEQRKVREQVVKASLHNRREIRDIIDFDDHRSAGLIEDVLRGVGSSIPFIALGLVNPALAAGGGVLAESGQLYDQMRENGVDSLTARKTAWTAGVPLGLLDSAGEMYAVKSWLGKKGLGKIAADILADMGIEGSTEMTQSFGEEAAVYLAANPDCTAEDLKRDLFSGRVIKDALYSGLVGSLAGGTFTAAGHGARGAYNLITNKQHAVNQEKANAYAAVMRKEVAGAELNEAEQVISEHVANMSPAEKRSVFFQAALESDNRDAVAETLSEKFGADAKPMMHLLDNIARSTAERAGWDDPARFYEEHLQGAELAEFAEWVSRDDRLPFAVQGQLYQVDPKDENFRKWFGDSKAVDAKGEPLEVYHGTPDARFLSDDAVFKSQKDRIGIGRPEGVHWFTSTRATAATYADAHRSFDYQNAEPNIIPAYLKLNNPLVIDARGRQWRDAQRQGKTSDVITEAKENGHDGVIIKNVKDDYKNSSKTKTTDTYAVFESIQIKSIDNRGTFDPNDPNIFHQAGRDNNPKGATSFDDGGRAFITFFEKGDATTTVHEIGHVLRRVIQRYDQTGYGAVCDWLGVAPDAELTVEQEEQFAKGFETYIAEGAAPTMGMQSVFKRLKKMMLDIYLSVKRIGTPISDDVRRVFDTWVSTEIDRESDPIRDMAGWWNVKDLEAVASDLLSQDDDFDAIATEARRRVALRLEKERRAADRTIRKELRAQAVGLVENGRYYQSLKALREGGGFNLEALKAMRNYSPDEMTELRRTRLINNAPGEGVLPDQFAFEHGYEVADDFIDELLNRPTGHDALIKQEFDLLYSDYQDSLEAFDINSADMEAIINEEIDLINSKLPKISPGPSKAIAKLAKAVTDGLDEDTYVELKRKLADLELAMRQNWSKSSDGGQMVEGDLTADIAADLAAVRDQNRAQKLADRKAMLEAKAKTAAAIRDHHATRLKASKIVAHIKKVSKSKILKDTDIKPQIDRLMAMYHIAGRKFSERMNQVPELGQFLDSRIAAGLLPEDAKAVLFGLPEIAYRTTSDGREIMAPKTVEQLEAIQNAVDMLHKLAKEESAEQRAAYEAKITELDAHIYANRDRVRRDLTGKKDANGKRVGLKEENAKATLGFVGGLLGKLKRLDFIAQGLDGYKDGLDGAAYAALMAPLNRAHVAEQQLRAEYGRHLSDIFGKLNELYGKAWATETVQIGEEAYTKQTLFMLALNSGSPDNIKALIHGNGFKDAAEVKEWVTELYKQEGFEQAVNGIHAMLETLFPMLDDLHVRAKGFHLKKVRGAYFPMAFTHDAWLRKALKDAGQQEDLFANSSLAAMAGHEFLSGKVHAKVAAGHREERKGGDLEIELKFTVLERHMARAIHDITHTEAVNEVKRVVNHPRFRRAVESTMMPGTYEQLGEILKEVASPAIGKPLINLARRNISAALLGCSFGTASGNLSSVTQTIDEIGMVHFLRAIKQISVDPAGVYEMVKEKDILIKQRAASLDPEVAEVFNQLHVAIARETSALGVARDVQDKMIAASFFLFRCTDMVTILPTWIGGYNKAIEDLGYDDAQAVEYARRMVERAQVAGSAKDRSAFQHNTGYVQPFLNMFSSYAMLYFNRMARMVDRYRISDRNMADHVELFKTFMLQCVIQSWLTYTLTHFDPPDDDEWVLLPISDSLYGVPILRDVVRGLMGPKGFGKSVSFTPASAAYEAMARWLDSVGDAAFGEDEVDWFGLVEDSVNLAGYGAGLPSRQMMVIFDELQAMREGEDVRPLRFLFHQTAAHQRHDEDEE